MKANEEPEKIYCIPTEGGCYYITTIKPEPPFAEGVEYIRTDAFIEKAKKWFEKQNEWRDINGIKHCDMESFEDFVKYIKGE